MKKITFLLALFALCVTGSYAQVQVGSGTNVSQSVPFEPYYGYTYAQSIYTSAEVNASGNITSLQWRYSGGTLLPNSQELVVYLGHTAKTAFESNTDFVPLADLTQVYSGGITVTAAGGWVTLTFTTPFAYNGTSNLVVAVEENKTGYDGSGDSFYNTAVTGNRSIYAYSDSVNPSPADPATGSLTRGAIAFVPNVIFGGIQQACPNPNNIVSSVPTLVGASFAWDASGATAWEVLALENGSTAPTATTSGTAVTGTPAFTATTLSAATTYQFYVRTVCGDVYGPWSSPITFTTLCNPTAGDLTQDFTSTAIGAIPDCWSKLRVSSSNSSTVGVANTGNTATPNNALRLYNDSDNSGTIIASTPNLSALAAGTHRLRFTASGGANYTLIVGTISDITNPDSFVPVKTITLTSTKTEYYVNFPVTQNSAIAFKHGLGGTYRTINIDDIFWEPVPAAAPDCIAEFDLSLAINEECGNAATVFEWPAVTGAEGYYFSIGTAPGVYDLVTNQELPGTATTFSYTGNIATDYYFSLVPFNGAGAAADCIEFAFTTSSIGCYCPSVPASVDDLGITNVQLGSADFQVPTQTVDGEEEALTYYDASESPVQLGTGLTANLQVTFQTGFTYNTHVWIDYNDNYVFEASEKVFTGESTSDDIAVLNASFAIPATAALGQHSMRISAADSGLTTANPCYNGNYGVTIDLAVDIVQPTCTPGTVTTSVIAGACATSQYYVDVNVTSLGTSTTTTISNGTQSFPVTAVGVAHVGPFASGSTNTLTLVNSDALCSTVIGTFSYTCPPLNDNCSGAFALTVNPALTCTAVTSGNVKAATDSGVAVPVDGIEGVANDDVWYKFVATASSQKITINNIDYSDFEFYYLVGEVFQGTCDGLVSLVEFEGGDSQIVNGLTIGQTYYVRVYTESDEEGADTTFDICVTTLPGAPANDNCAGAVTLNASATTTCAAVTAGGLISATDSGVAIPADSTVEGTPNDDVWYQFVATSTSHKIDITNIDYSDYEFYDLVHEVFQGTCDGLVSLAESDPNTSVVTGLTVGQTYYIRVYSYSDEDGADTTFNICVTTPPNPPANDDCVNAIALTVGNSLTSNAVESTVAGATNSTGVANPDCGTYTGGDIWFSAVVPADGNITFETGASGTNTSFDSVIAAYSGTCGSMTQIGCIDQGSANNFSKLVLTGRTPGEVVYARVYKYSTSTVHPFVMSAYNTTLSVGGFDNANFAYYPNPVKNVLNLSYTQNISDIAVFNLLGQQVMTKTVNSNSGQVDMSNLSAGTYMVKVTADNQVKTIKVIKE